LRRIYHERFAESTPSMANTDRRGAHRQVLPYGIVGDMVGMPPVALAQPLGLIMRYCEENDLPPLTLLVVQTREGKPGKG